MKSNACKSLTVSSSSKSILDFAFTQTQIDSAVRAIICAHTNAAVCLWTAGETPTATHGIEIAAGYSIEVTDRANIGNIKLIRQGSSDSVVTILLETDAA